MKVSVPVSNDFCPQTLFLYGTYKEVSGVNPAMDFSHAGTAYLPVFGLINKF